MALTDVGKGLDAQTMRLALSRWKGRLRRQPAIRRAAHSRLGRRLRETLTSGR
jgi:hypothetical protein